MDFWGVMALLARRWYVAGPMLLLTLLGAAAAYTTGPPRFFSSAVVLLVVPPTGSTVRGDAAVPDRTNPLALADYNLTVNSAILAQEMSSPDFAARIGVGDSGSARLSVHNGAANPEQLVSGPFVFVNADSDSPVVAQELVRRAVAQARVSLQRRQVEVEAPPATLITLLEIIPPTEPAGGHGSRARAAFAAVCLGLVGTGAVALLIDRAASRRRPADRPARGTTGGPTMADPPTGPGVARALVTSGGPSAPDRRA